MQHTSHGKLKSNPLSQLKFLIKGNRIKRGQKRKNILKFEPPFFCSVALSSETRIARSPLALSHDDTAEKGGIYLPLNHRQKINHGGSLTVQSVERMADEGEYSCIVRDADGETATASTFVSVVAWPYRILEAASLRMVLVGLNAGLAR
ncbi:uncharacterized protein CEXT_428461 [Caerostris extrusa]|uniref:Ig-like domain-containing protein n=1 Tax=Caerostris extrusa TaxID=172846 RepID=A0AAV4WW07_CAEEX|nr:uncharacterized protein CEXT_428461 [Caerostris extrusa]